MGNPLMDSLGLWIGVSDAPEVQVSPFIVPACTKLLRGEVRMEEHIKVAYQALVANSTILARRSALSKNQV